MATRIQTFVEAQQEQPSMFRAPHHEQFPFTWYRTMRAEAPIFYDESLHSWSFFLYEDVDLALSDFSTFSSQPSLDVPPSDLDSLVRTDPPRHQQIRSLVSQAFTPRSIALLA